MFDEDGKSREDAAGEAADTKPDRQPEQKSEEAAQETKKEDTEQGKEEHYQVPEMNFHNFILSLYTSVIFSLGELADPVSGEKKKDLQAAKQTIDILGMLKEKTEGNLDTSEKELLDGILSESRMGYVRESEKS
ncbi:MAG: DUF1844 domain-containing protein [Deltaproteobacteria bacterium]|nr:DUF1844 domain-containing protein [Deltaproteobacteria bacterium]MBW2672849.1 DUF1844 domain-containing protein [Deltaproteobacteria bacterium]